MNRPPRYTGASRNSNFANHNVSELLDLLAAEVEPRISAIAKNAGAAALDAGFGKPEAFAAIATLAKRASAFLQGPRP